MTVYIGSTELRVAPAGIARDTGESVAVAADRKAPFRLILRSQILRFDGCQILIQFRCIRLRKFA